MLLIDGSFIRLPWNTCPPDRLVSHWASVGHKPSQIFLEKASLVNATATAKHRDLQVPAVQRQPLGLFIHMFTYYHKYPTGHSAPGITAGLIYRGTEMSRGHSG